MSEAQDDYDKFAKSEEERRSDVPTALVPDSGVEVAVDKDGVARGDSGGRDVTDPSTAPRVPEDNNPGNPFNE